MTASGSAARAFMSIGEVLAQLRPEFPDTTISKLRFLEAEGLVEPERTAAGYRKYSQPDLSRLRYILTAQRDHYLPLRVIREQLEAIDHGHDTGPPVSESTGRPATGGPAVVGRIGIVGDDAFPTAGDFSWSSPEVRFSRAELLDRAGMTEAALRQLESYGMVSPRGAGWYDAEALAIAETVVAMSRFGLEPRHLRAYRAAADREVGLFEQVVTPLLRQRGPEARERAEEALRELAALSIRLHTALVQTRFRSSLGG